jgi:hypothetical protein
MKTKIIASSLAGLAILGGTVGFALTDASSANAATNAAQSAVTQTTGSGHGYLRHHRRELRKEAAADVAKQLGITVDQLKTDLKSGESIAQVAQSKGISPTTVIDSLVKDVDARIEKGVTNDVITKDFAAKVEAKVPAAVTKVVNHQFGQHKAGS